MRICPRCEAQLIETPCGNIRVDRCEKCGGAWFDFEEIDRAISEIPRSDLARSLPEGTAAHPDGVPPGKCPACGGNFVRVRGEIEHRNVRFDTCMVCFGRWLDRDELAQLAGGDLASKFKNLLRRIFGGGREGAEA